MAYSTKLETTAELREIAEHNQLGMLICAPAGCGKTEALAFRVEQILNRYNFGNSGRKILILTFTNNARDNIGDRLLHYLSPATIRERVTLCNFHGLAARIIASHGHQIQLDSSWQIANYDWLSQELSRRAYSRDAKKRITEELHNAKLANISDDEVWDALQKRDTEDARIALDIEECRTENKVITFDDQIRVALWILRNEKVLSLYRNHFFAAIVDEFQDLTPQQLCFVTLLCQNNVTYAGDISQGIYSFAGARGNAALEHIRSQGITEFSLTSSFRSSPAILRAINSLQPLTNGSSFHCAFPEHWEGGGLFGSIGFNNHQHEAQWISSIAQAVYRHCPHHRIGIISRTNYRMNYIRRALSNNHISYYDWGDGLFSPSVAKVLRNICQDRSISNRDDPLTYMRTLSFEMGANDTEELDFGLSWLCDHLFQSEATEVLRRIKTKVSGETVTSAPGIHCLTGHAGKGQQFDWVFIPGLEEGCIPDYRAKTKDEISEEAKILSVMLSRARIGAVVSYSSAPSNGYPTRSSRFLSHLKHVEGIRTGSDDIISWFQNADWNALASM